MIRNIKYQNPNIKVRMEIFLYEGSGSYGCIRGPVAVCCFPQCSRTCHWIKSTVGLHLVFGF
jgi:hypothetical protein